MKFDGPFLAGGLLCLNFCNTFDHLQTPPGYDFFPDRATILAWGQAMGVLPPDFQDTSAAAGQSIVPALETRSLIFRLLMPVIGSEAPAESDLASFQARLEEVSAEMKFVSTTGGYGLVCGAADPVEQILCAVVRSAADLFLSNQLEKVKQCKGCGWLFYDISRNHSRRWCNMKVCGNRAKARRHYARVRQKQAESEIASRKSLAR